MLEKLITVDPRARRRPAAAGRRDPGDPDPGLRPGHGIRGGGDHRRLPAGRSGRASGGLSGPAGPWRRHAVRRTRLPPGRGEVAQDHRAGPPSGGRGRSTAGASLLDARAAGARRRDRARGTRAADRQPVGRSAPARALPPDARGLRARREPAAGGDHRHGHGDDRARCSSGPTLDQPMLRTFSRSRPEGWRLRSPLERYDHEHAFRVDIAAVAQQQTGDATTRSAPAGRADRQCGVRPLPVVGALPPAARRPKM